MVEPLGRADRRPRLLVLGGGAYQIPAMRAAQGLGVEVITVDWSGAAPGASIADSFFVVDTTNRQAVAELALAKGVDAVISPCTDVAVPTQAFVAAKIGASGPALEAAEILSDKGRFRAYQAGRGLQHPRTIEAESGGFDTSLLAPGSYVLKPARSSGSKGIFVVTAGEIEGRLPDTIAYCPDGRFVVERFISGAQGTVEGLWIEGQIALSVVTDRLTACAPLVATMGHLWPSRFEPDVIQRCLSAIADVLVDLAVPDTPFDCDFVVGPDGPVVLELAPRLGGNSLSKLVRAATGVDLPSEAVRLAFSKTDSLPPSPSAGPLGPAIGVAILSSPTSGSLTFNASGEAALKARPWLAEIVWDVPAGSPVRAFENGRDRVGEALIFAPDRETLDTRLSELKELLNIGANPI